MDKNRWNRIKEIFHKSLELSPSEQNSFIDRECKDDGFIKDCVKRMIDADRHSGSFLENPVTLSSIINKQETFADERIGSQLAGYTIKEVVGQGGMGTVYRAEKDEESFRRIVAIKVVKHGMDTSVILRRFYTERQILADLDHPNIARLIDGGMTQDGLPYFIMEYVDGKPITEYCDQNRATLGERIELFIKVCEAVQYAHQNLIVHRDIKPSNILVTGDGKVKLLDFGIAKMLSTDGSNETFTFTTAKLPVMTPEYASPEQIKGKSVTTASDVYSLGVLLYEILSGFRPYEIEIRTPAEIERTVLETQPVRPSMQINIGKTGQHDLTNISASRSTTSERLRKMLRGDLDNIVMAALRKEHERRYESAEQMLGDIYRYKNNLPVSARPDTMRYKASKFIRRHAFGVAATSIIIIVFITGFIATIWQAHIATEARIIAEDQRLLSERRFNEVRELARRFIFDFHDEIEHLSGSRGARELLVSTALEYLERLANEAEGELDLLHELAGAYVRVGDIQGNPYMANLGNTAGALEAYNNAYQIREKLIKIDPENAGIKRSIAHTLNKIGDLQVWTGNTDEALISFQDAITILNEMIVSEPENKRLKQELAASLVKIGDTYSWHGNESKALPIYVTATEILEELAHEDPDNVQSAINLSVGKSKIGYALTRMGDFEEALIYQLEALNANKALSEKHPDHAGIHRSIAINANQVGSIYMNMGNYGAALENFNYALTKTLRLHEADTGDPLITSDVTYTRNKIGEALLGIDDHHGALEQFKKACEMRKMLADKDPDNEGFQRDLSVSMTLVGCTYMTLAEKSNRKEYWVISRDWLNQSLKIINGMRERGTIRDGDRGKPEELQELIVKCEKMISG